MKNYKAFLPIGTLTSFNANVAMSISTPAYQNILKQLGIALLFLLSGYFINHNFTNNNSVCAFWPVTGLVLALLLVDGKRYIEGVILGSLLLNMLSNDSLWAAGNITLTHVLAALLGRWLLTRTSHSALSLNTLRDYLQLIILGGGVACIGGAIVGTWILLFSGYITPADYFKNALNWWMKDTLGVVLITPLILAWWQKAEKIKAAQLLESLLLVGMTLLVGQIVFLGWFHEYFSETPKVYWVFLCVTWAGIRLGSRRVTLVVLISAIQALVGAYNEVGFFAHEISNNTLYNYWAFMLILSVVGMTITTYVNEIKWALMSLQLKDSALNAAANGIVITDPNGRIEWANPAFSRLTGYSLNDVYNFNPSVSVQSDTQDEAHLQSMRETIFANKVWQGELINRRKDGSLYDEEMTITPLANEEGEVTHFVAVKQEITERRQMEEKLRDRDDFNTSILNSLTSHIAVLNEQGVIVAVNNAWRQFAKDNGFSEANQNMLGVNYLDVCKKAINQPYGNEASEAQAGIVAVLAGEQQSFHLEYPCHSPDQQLWFHMNVSPLHGSRGAGVISHENITQRKQAEAALQESESRYRALLQDASDAVIIADMSGNLEEINRAGEHLLGYSRGEIFRMNWMQIHPGAELDKLRQHFDDFARNGSAGPIETKILRKDGRIVDVEIRPTLAEINGRKVMQKILIDLTERKRLEKERLAAENAQRDVLVREVHHRIKNNLQGIIGILRQFAENHPETEEPLNQAISQVQSVAVIHGLQGSAPLAKVQACELTVAIAAGIESLWKRPVTVGILDCGVPYTITEVEAVPLALVLNELICNAIKHGGANGHVRITLNHEPHGDSIHLTIYNTGLIPAGFGLENITGFGTGLQLVASLLPRAGARLTWEQQDGIVVTKLTLDEPVIHKESTL
ncbi:MAG TPA: PAS domain S-box protein [Methylobacter sp.]